MYSTRNELTALLKLDYLVHSTAHDCRWQIPCTLLFQETFFSSAHSCCQGMLRASYIPMQVPYTFSCISLSLSWSLLPNAICINVVFTHQWCTHCDHFLGNLSLSLSLSLSLPSLFPSLPLSLSFSVRACRKGILWRVQYPMSLLWMITVGELFLTFPHSVQVSEVFTHPEQHQAFSHIVHVKECSCSY